MKNIDADHFDEAAANWDAVPRRIALAHAVGEAILHHAQPTQKMDVLDYGCGTGLLGLFLLPHVRSVMGADCSLGMLNVLDDKIRSSGLQRMRTQQLDLERDPVPERHYHLIVTNMVLHHVDRTDALLAAFYAMLLPGGIVAIADLDTEPGLFHEPETSHVFHHGFDRRSLKDRLLRTGFVDVQDQTVYVIRKSTASGVIRDFPVFLIFSHRS